MSEDKISIEFEKETLESIFKEAGVDLPDAPSADDINNAVVSLKKSLTPSASKVEEAEEPEKKEEAQADPSINPDDKGATTAQEQTPIDEVQYNGKHVLVVDDLGVVNYQLSCLFKREGFKVHTTTSISEAIEYFKQRKVEVAVLDLYLPSEREGLILLEEIVKIKKTRNTDCKIIMMSSDIKPDIKKLCKSMGANKFIEKTTGWHEQIVEVCSNV